MASNVTILSTGRKLHHNSSFFREPFVFKYLPRYLKKRFPDATSNGVQINLGACSQGEDAWALAMVLENDDDLKIEESPINASDINEGVVNIAKSGILSFLARTLTKAREVVPNIEEFFGSMPNNDSNDIERQELLDEYRRLLEQAGFKKKTGSGEAAKYVSVTAEQARLNMLYRVSEGLRRQVEFKAADFKREFNTDKFDKPCLVIFRNALQHFNAEEREEFANALFSSLEPGSSLVIGSGDIQKDVPRKLFDAGFEPSNPKYTRQCFQISGPIIKAKDPKALIFEKNRGLKSESGG
ncbi:MAG: hypothetical protein HYZ79_02725 [Candidatus Melainabacteria bacterium]|nr:hypothetical protein [Candidatus Melainabacteria bacterium]